MRRRIHSCKAGNGRIPQIRKHRFVQKIILDKTDRIVYHTICCRHADVAQVVAHLIGSEEVTGPSPVIS